MSIGVSTKSKLRFQLEEADLILKELFEKVNKKLKFDDFEYLVQHLLQKDKEIKETLKDVEEQLKIQTKIDKLRADCVNSDAQIQACQKELKKSELLLSTALYYCRQKLDSMVNAVKNPIDIEELITFSHRISFNHGVIAPDNWIQGDPRRPYPNKKEIRRGYLGFLDDSGNFRPGINEAFAQAIPSSSNLSVNSTTNPIASGTSALQLSGSTMSTPGQHSAHLQGNVMHNAPESGASYAPNIILPGVNMVSSPLTGPVSNGSSVGWGHGVGIESISGHSQPPNAAHARHANSLAAMLSGQSGPLRSAGSSGSGQIPRILGASQGCPGTSSSNRTSGSPSPAAPRHHLQPQPLPVSQQSNSRSWQQRMPVQQPLPLLSDANSNSLPRPQKRKRFPQELSSGNESMERTHSDSSDSSCEESRR